MAEQIQRYFQHLVQELAALSPYAAPLKTLYLGGGTPSLLPPEAVSLCLELLHREFELSSLQEWTLEVNPEHTEPEALARWVAGGVNRVSLGVQSFDNEVLTRCGRLHQQGHIYTAVERIREAGINNWSLDLMYALPGQTLAQWRETLDRAVALAPQHVSLYALEIHPRTRFGFENIPDFSEDLAGEMYELACETLGKAGYVHYEIANFCQPGFASQHNQVYWQTRPFLAAGVGAHGYLQGRRYETPRELRAYYAQCDARCWNWQTTKAQTEAEAVEEFMFLGLRQLARGIVFSEFEARFGHPLATYYPQCLPELLQQKYLLPTERGLRLAPEAVGLSNRIFAEFLDPCVPGPTLPEMVQSDITC